MDGKRFRLENERLLADQQRADAQFDELRSQVSALNQAFVDSKNEAWENKKLAEYWQRVAEEREAEVEQLRSHLDQLVLENDQPRSQSQPTNPEAITILKNALPLKSSAGGAIKVEIRKALKLLS